MTKRVDGKLAVVNVTRYTVEQVNPPEGVKSDNWIKSGSRSDIGGASSLQTFGGDTGTAVGDDEGEEVQPSNPSRTVSDESDLEPSATAQETNRKARQGETRDPHLRRR